MISLAFTESISSFRLAFKRSRCRGKFFATIKHVDPIYICSPVLLNTSSSPCRLPGVPPGLYAKVRMVFGSSTLDQGHPGERGGKRETQSSLVFGSYSEASSRQTPEGAGQLPDSHSSLLPAPLPQDWRPGSGLRTWLLSPRRYPGALSTRYRACR